MKVKWEWIAQIEVVRINKHSVVLKYRQKQMGSDDWKDLDSQEIDEGCKLTLTFPFDMTLPKPDKIVY